MRSKRSSPANNPTRPCPTRMRLQAAHDWRRRPPPGSCRGRCQPIHPRRAREAPPRFQPVSCLVDEQSSLVGSAIVPAKCRIHRRRPNWSEGDRAAAGFRNGRAFAGRQSAALRGADVSPLSPRAHVPPHSGPADRREGLRRSRARRSTTTRICRTRTRSRSSPSWRTRAARASPPSSGASRSRATRATTAGRPTRVGCGPRRAVARRSRARSRGAAIRGTGSGRAT